MIAKLQHIGERSRNERNIDGSNRASHMRSAARRHHEQPAHSRPPSSWKGMALRIDPNPPALDRVAPRNPSTIAIGRTQRHRGSAISAIGDGIGPPAQESGPCLPAYGEKPLWGFDPVALQGAATLEGANALLIDRPHGRPVNRLAATRTMSALVRGHAHRNPSAGRHENGAPPPPAAGAPGQRGRDIPLSTPAESIDQAERVEIGLFRRRIVTKEADASPHSETFPLALSFAKLMPIAHRPCGGTCRTSKIVPCGGGGYSSNINGVCMLTKRGLHEEEVRKRCHTHRFLDRRRIGLLGLHVGSGAFGRLRG